MRLCYERNKTLRIYIINIVVNEVRILEINILCKELFEGNLFILPKERFI